MNRLRELREDSDMKLEDVAARLDVHPTTISKYELGQRSLTPDLINKFCDLYGVTADYLLGRSPLMSMELSPEEENIILALRRADDRAVEMVHVALAPFKQEESSSKAASTA